MTARARVYDYSKEGVYTHDDVERECVGLQCATLVQARSVGYEVIRVIVIVRVQGVLRAFD